ncbi:MAG: carboxypeptidase regulatory-like domain-containing protein [Acidobacteriota bacterium]|nr:carboxypeptidase regulatory-like domain-containing protein [Acidobacteriota bacterium]
MKSQAARLAWAACALVAVLCPAVPARAQAVPQTPPPGAIDINKPKPPPTAILRGRITTYPDGVPLARARVILNRPGLEHSWVTLTGEDGGYEITELDGADDYMLSASKTGYAPRMWGEQQLPTPPTPIKLADAQVLTDIDVALVQQLWVAGKILDADGTPFAGAIVSALRPVFVDDRREMVTVAEIITNDRGEYRLFGLPAGQYFISAVDPAFLATRDHQGPLVYAATFYPGVASPETATRLTLEPGLPRENVDFSLHIVKPARVSGKITSYDNKQLAAGAVVMSPFRADKPASFTVTDVDIRPDGTYEFANVPSGRFIIRSRGEIDRDGIALFAAFTLSVAGRNIEGVDMTLYPGARVQGLIEWAGTSPRPLDISQVRVRAPMADGSLFGDALTGNITETSGFAIRGAMVGSHYLRVEDLPEPWSLDVVYFRGQDVTDIPMSFQFGEEVTSLRLVLTDVSTRIDGQLVSTPGDDFESYKVVAFPANQMHWKPGSRHIKLVRPDRKGRFRIHGLPPTVYYLVATRDVDESDITDPRVLDTLTASALVIRLDRGEHKRERVPVRRATNTTRAAASLASAQ